MARMSIQKYRVTEIRNENDHTKTWRLVSVDGKRMDFKPGQFVLVYLLDSEGNPTREVRPYSISSSPSKTDFIELTIKDTPNFPAKLFSLGIGAEVGVAGPSGVFTLDESLPEIVFAVGGVGIAGVSSAIRYINEKKLPIKMTLFYSCSYLKDFIWLDEFRQIEKENENFTFVPVVTREEPENWQGETSRLTMAMIEKRADARNAHYYLCGSPLMVSGIEEMLKTIGVGRTMIKMEKWTGM